MTKATSEKLARRLCARSSVDCGHHRRASFSDVAFVIAHLLARRHHHDLRQHCLYQRQQRSLCSNEKAMGGFSDSNRSCCS